MRAGMENVGPRERAIEDGVGSLGDGDLVALVLGTGRAGEPVSVLAAAILEELGGLAGLSRAGVGEIAARAGVGAAKSARLAGAIELGRRVAIEAARRTDARFTSYVAVDAWARPRLANLDHEELWVLVLDGHHGLKAARRVGMGGLHGLRIAPRDVLRFALRDGGTSFVLVHNHPSGDPTPSVEDVHFTRRVVTAATIVGVPLLDHVVVARGGCASMLEDGAITETSADGSS
jgi:DNA repair protein RadC